MLQFHGEETPEFCAQFGVPYLKACRVKHRGRFARIPARRFPARRPGCSTATSRSTAASARASTGRWCPPTRQARDPVRRACPQANVGEAIRRVRPWARGRLERRRVGEGHQGRGEDRRFHRRGPKCGCMTLPDARGHFGPYGGVFVAETLTAALDELREAYERCAPGSGVPGRVPLRAQALRRPPEPGLSRQALVREMRRRADLPQARGPEPHRRAQDQQHHRPGAARARMGKPRVIAETGAGMHGVATATVAARFGMECVVYMGSRGRQAPGGRTSTA